MMQQQTNLNYQRNAQGYIDTYQQQKQMQFNRMGVNVHTSMYNNNMNNNFINNQQRMAFNQQQIAMQSHHNPMYNQYEQHNIQFNSNNQYPQNQYIQQQQQQQAVNMNMPSVPFAQHQAQIPLHTRMIIVLIKP